MKQETTVETIKWRSNRAKNLLAELLNEIKELEKAGASIILFSNKNDKFRGHVLAPSYPNLPDDTQIQVRISI